MDHSPPAPLSMGFSRQEYWSGMPFPAPDGCTGLQNYNHGIIQLKYVYHNYTSIKLLKKKPTRMTRTLFSFDPLSKNNMVEVCVKFLFIHQTFIE